MKPYDKCPRVILVTGAKGALGSVVANRFLQAGCEVYGTVLEAQGSGTEGRVQWIQMDVTDSRSIAAGLRSFTHSKSPSKIDALIHCAGGFRFCKTEDATDADLDFLIDTNLRSAFLLAREILPGMKERNFGRIVLISSRASLQAPAGMGAYAAAKAGLNSLTHSLAEEVKRFDINVNAVLPTIIDTAANRKDMPQADFSSWVDPVDLAEIIFSLTQPWGKAIHGALIPVAGRV